MYRPFTASRPLFRSRIFNTCMASYKTPTKTDGKENDGFAPIGTYSPI